LNESKKISVRRALLPKATAVRLQPIESSFWEISDTRAALEFALRSRFTVLSPNQVIAFRYAGKTYQVLVLEVEPVAPGVRIVNTDCVVNIEPPLSGGGAGDSVMASNASTSAAAKTSTDRSGQLTLGTQTSGVAAPGQPCVYALKVPDAAVFAENDLLVSVSDPPAASAPPAGEEGEPDVYVDVAPNRTPSLLEHRWAWNGAGKVGSVRVSDEAAPSAGRQGTVGTTSSALSDLAGQRHFRSRCHSCPRQQR